MVSWSIGSTERDDLRETITLASLTLSIDAFSISALLFGVRRSMEDRTASRVECSASHLQAVLGPMPFAPSIQSHESPVRDNRSAICEG